MQASLPKWTVEVATSLHNRTVCGGLPNSLAQGLPEFTIEQVPGFEIVAVESDKIYESRGRVQRIVGINRQWFHHAQAVRIPEEVFSEFLEAFQTAHKEFNYYGPTEYKRQEIVRLCNELRSKPWAAPVADNLVQDETEEVVQKILGIAEKALANEQSLLVLGP